MAAKLVHGLVCLFAIALLGGELGLLALYLLSPLLPQPGP